MKDWDFVELRHLSSTRNIPDSTLYQNSLNWRWRRAHFHAEKADEEGRNLFRASFVFGDQRYVEVAFAYEAHVEACAYAIHAASDIVGQIVNLSLLAPPIDSHAVTIGKVCQRLCGCHIAPSVLSALYNLRDAPEMRYIVAFVNTIKHRQLIKTNFRAEGGEETRREAGMVFVSFTYKKEEYPEVWGSDIIGSYKSRIHDLMSGVGCALNEYLQKG
jgi:hypothetical protein